jgi:hypothetical protein
MSDQWLFIAFILPLALFMAAVPIGLSTVLGPASQPDEGRRV